MRSLIVVTVLALAAACQPTPGSEPMPKAGPGAAPTVGIAPAHGSSPEVIEPAPSSQPAPSAESGAARFEAAYCKADVDCNWDDPCVPTRCQKRDAATDAIRCSESRPAEGSCICIESWCTLRPSSPAPTRGEDSCQSDAQCAVDVGAGRCVAVADAREALRVGPIDREGPYCDCVAGSCAYRWAEPLACTSDAECWWERKGGRIKPARPDKPRKLPFRPCQDGEIDAVCSRGSCQVRGWSC